MNQDFYDNLSEIQRHYLDLYKSNGPFFNNQNFTDSLNTLLGTRAAIPEDFKDAIETLDQLTLIAEMEEDMLLFRVMDIEILGNHSERDVLTYPAFMSTTDNIEAVTAHYSSVSSGHAALLKINCPKGTYFAWLEHAMTNGFEQELLLARNHTFLVVQKFVLTDPLAIEKESDREVASYINALTILTLQLIANH
jgi:hypothetical protein